MCGARMGKRSTWVPATRDRHAVSCAEEVTMRECPLSVGRHCVPSSCMRLSSPPGAAGSATIGATMRSTRTSRRVTAEAWTPHRTTRVRLTPPRFPRTHRATPRSTASRAAPPGPTVRRAPAGDGGASRRARQGARWASSASACPRRRSPTVSRTAVAGPGAPRTRPATEASASPPAAPAACAPGRRSAWPAPARATDQADLTIRSADPIGRRACGTRRRAR